MYTEIFWDLAIWQQIRIDSAAQTSQIMGLIRVGERTHACAIRNILPWLLIDLITSSNERSADSNEIICPSTTVICTILVQQYCSTRWHLTKGVPWMWVCEKLEKEFCVFLKVPWYQSKLCLSYNTAHGSEVYSTSLSFEIFSFPAPGCRWGIAQMGSWPWVKGRERQRIWLWEWRFESWLSFYLRNI